MVEDKTGLNHVKEIIADDVEENKKVGEISDEMIKSSVRREIPSSSDAIVEGKILGVKVNFVIDTGAEKTLISKKIYDQIDPMLQPTLGKRTKVSHAGGKPLKSYGRCTVPLELGPLTLTRSAIITEIADDCLVGMDILKEKGVKPADIMLSQGKMFFHEKEIPLLQHIINRTRKVRAADHFVIQPLSETIIDAIVDRK